MKFMKLGSRPDTFLTEEATRTLISDVPSDITIQINNMSYLLHKYPLLPKCGLLQRLLSETEESSSVTLGLGDVPGGEEAFEMCVKFCYGITISISAHNIVSAFCAAKFLKMTEAVENGNFVMKLETFLSSCILEGWKDSVVTLQNTASVYNWSESHGIVRKCIESVVDKILTPAQKVSWSYTYTRPGYDKRRQQSVPKDWWTEDVSFLNIDMFRCIITAIKSTNVLHPQLIGEALHVYACRWLPDITETRLREGSTSRAGDQDSPDRKQRIIEIIVSLIPVDKGSISFKFLLRLLSKAHVLGVSTVTKTELLRLSGLQLEDAFLDDLLLPVHSLNDQSSFGIDLVKIVLENFLRQWKRQTSTDESQSLRSVNKVGKLVDAYLQVASRDANMPVEKVVSLAEMLPGVARPDHDRLYRAIDIYLKEHPDLSKTDKKQLCRILDCQKLSQEARAHAVKNEHLPLRTVVQLLFFEQEKSNISPDLTQRSSDKVGGIIHDIDKVKLREDDHRTGKVKSTRNPSPGLSDAHQNLRKPGDKLQLRPELSFKVREVTGPEVPKGSHGQERRASDQTHINARRR